MKVYGIYIGFDFLSIAVRNIDSPAVTPLVALPLHKAADRYEEVSAAFNRVASKRYISSPKTSVALLSFESNENVLFATPVANEVPDITEMMSWEMFMRTGESVKNYFISTSFIYEKKQLVAASKTRDIDFFTKQVSRLGLKIITIEPSLVSASNVFEMNYDVAGQNLVALASCQKIAVAYIKDGKLVDIAQSAVHHTDTVSSQDIMKIRAEISSRNELTKDVPIYITGDLLANKVQADTISSDIANCFYLDPFKCIATNEKSNKELMEKYSMIFGVAVSLSQKMV
ncbi:MAG: hypothetical protein FWF51_03510 [Chitinivibrionia bacterium]|nr:hypothetical protein [Chitinivibrionia bacterium]